MSILFLCLLRSKRYYIKIFDVNHEQIFRQESQVAEITGASIFWHKKIEIFETNAVHIQASHMPNSVYGKQYIWSRECVRCTYCTYICHEWLCVQLRISIRTIQFLDGSIAVYYCRSAASRKKVLPCIVLAYVYV